MNESTLQGEAGGRGQTERGKEEEGRKEGRGERKEEGDNLLEGVCGASGSVGDQARFVGFDLGSKASYWIGDICDNTGDTVQINVRIAALDDALLIAALLTGQRVIGVLLFERKRVRLRL